MDKMRGLGGKAGFPSLTLSPTLAHSSVLKTARLLSAKLTATVQDTWTSWHLLQYSTSVQSQRATSPPLRCQLAHSALALTAWSTPTPLRPAAGRSLNSPHNFLQSLLLLHHPPQGPIHSPTFGSERQSPMTALHLLSNRKLVWRINQQDDIHKRGYFLFM